MTRCRKPQRPKLGDPAVENVNSNIIKICHGDAKVKQAVWEGDPLDFIVWMHFVQRKDIKLEWVSVDVDRRVNVVQDREFDVQVVSQEGVDGEMKACYFSVFSGTDNSSNYFMFMVPRTIIYCMK